MAKTVRKVFGAVFIITALILTQIPMPEAFAANTVEDFQMDEDILVEYTGFSTSVTVPDSVKTIGTEAFSQNTDIGSVNVGKNTQEIRSMAFSGCKYLTSVTIPDQVTSIGDYAFSGCEYLSKVKIGKNVEKIGTGVFAACNSLSSIDLDKNNKNFIFDRGALYDADGETLIAYLNGYKSDTYNMPDAVKKINAYSFWGNDTLEYIDLSNYLSEIPGYAFSNCKALKNITIPYSVNTIDAKAFENCVSLTDVVIPASVSYIDPTAFDGCRKLNIIADKGTAGYAFYQEYLARNAAEVAEEEEGLILPGIGRDAGTIDTANDSHEETTVKSAVNDPSNVDYMPSSDPLLSAEDSDVKAKTLVVGGSAMLFLDSSQAQVYSGGQPQETISVEGNYASNNTGIADSKQDVDKQDSTASSVIYDQSKGGYLPKYAVLSDKIAAQGFYADQSLTTYQVADGITSIGEFAFARSGLISVNIPNGVKTIGYGAFYHCDSLSKVTIPDSVTEIEAYAFDNTPYLTDFMEQSQSPYLIVGDGILLGYKGSSSDVLLPEGIKRIAPNCFKDHAEIVSLTLPDSLEVIGEDAFHGCSSLKSVSGGNGVKEIRDRAFMNCSLEDYTFPSGIEKIGLRAIDFSETDKLSDTKVVAFSDSVLPEIAVGTEAKRLSNASYRENALYDVNVVIVPENCDDYDGTVLDSSLPGFSGLVVSVDGKGNAKIKECLAGSVDALHKLGESFVYRGVTYTIPMKDMELSANRKASAEIKEVPVLFDESRDSTVSAVFSSNAVAGTLSIKTDSDAKDRICAAYKELFGTNAPDMEAYDITLTDATGSIPITRFGKNELTISMPIPENIKGNRYRVICLDQDGQLEEVDSITKDGTISFSATHLSDYAIYATGESTVSLALENGKLVQNFKKDDSPDTGDHSLPVNYVFAAGMCLIGAALLVYRRKSL